MKKQQDKYDILKTYYGYDTFRDGQEAVSYTHLTLPTIYSV